jgi:hypothetical protein
VTVSDAIVALEIAVRVDERLRWSTMATSMMKLKSEQRVVRTREQLLSVIESEVERAGRTT